MTLNINNYNLQLQSNTSLVLAIVWAINNDYGKYSTNPLTIGEFASNEVSRGYQNDLINVVLQLVSGHAGIKFRVEASTVEENSQNIAGIAPRSDTFGSSIMRIKAIWFLDSLAAYIRLESDLLNESNLYERNGYFCIIYTGTETNRLDTIKRIFRRLYTIYVLNVNVFLQFGSNTYVYTYFPFSESRCHSTQPKFHISFRGIRKSSHFEMRKYFFPNKLKNMYGCELVISTWEHKPYVLLTAKPGEILNVNDLTGIEGKMFGTLAQKMNFSMRLAQSAGNDRGFIFSNGTTTGATNLIVEGLANITFVCFMYNQARAMVMLPSTSYLSFPIVLCIPRGRPMSPYERLVRPFRYIIWSCFSVSFVFGLSAILMVKAFGSARAVLFMLGQNNHMPCTNYWFIMVGGLLTTRSPRRNFARYLLAVWLLYTLVLRSAYTGELYIILQDGRARSQVRTINEVIAHNYVFFLLEPLEIIIKGLVPNARIEVLNTGKYSMASTLRFLQNSEDGNVVMPLLEPTVKSYNQQRDNVNNEVSILPEQIIIAPLALYMRKHSYLKHQIDDLLISMMSSGIVHKYQRMYLHGNSKFSNKHSYEPTKLSPWLLMGVFTLHLGMLSAASIVFFLEVLSVKSERLKQAIDWANHYIC